MEIIGTSADEILYGTNFSDQIYGGDGNDTLYGYDSWDMLYGGRGNDTLIGGGGDDILNGGVGDDTYSMVTPGDIIIEYDTPGTDLVIALTNFSLIEHSQYLENLTLTGLYDYTGTGNIQDNIITGNARHNTLYGLSGNDTIYGGDGNDTIYGGPGADLMYGNAGNDMFFVDDAGDRVVELSGEGIDTVYSSVAFSLYDNPWIENLYLTGSADLTVYGNDQANTIKANAGNNVIFGFGGDDFIYGGEGDDVIRGGTGVDIMIGNDGDDIYYVDDTDDYVMEYGRIPGEHNIVYSSVSFSFMQNSRYIEELILTGSNDLWGVGSVLENTITGTLGNNSLYGMDADDIIYGRDGNDTLYGGTGADTMFGNAGDDTFFVDDLGDIVREFINEGMDQVFSQVSFSLEDQSQHLENLTLLGTADINGTGNLQDNVIIGTTGSNILNGEAGRDAIYGLAGDDTINGGIGADILVGGAGVDSMDAGNDAATDTFVFTDISNSGLGVGNFDVISNFESGEDLIDLHLIDADTSTAGMQSLIYNGTSGVANGVWYQASGADLMVYADVTGDAEADFSFMVTTIGGLAEADFIL
ncbi:calcium-binding protein [uncultured Cohaesibacter sp.]|uniref:calcium-binding protein n=1 Tax=uncultured Cohaesibacter sp. TaxID=1002546 RepID=UPI0029C80EB5|nr:calcium-binding protein [uncultured Cohaesibacter sp.]